MVTSGLSAVLHRYVPILSRVRTTFLSHALASCVVDFSSLVTFVSYSQHWIPFPSMTKIQEP